MATSTDEAWVADRSHPYKLPHDPLNIPRHLIPLHKDLQTVFPAVLSKIILDFCFPMQLQARLIESLRKDFDNAERFYKMIIFGGLRIANTIMWLPLPYWHPLRDKAIDMFCDFENIPWVENDPNHPRHYMRPWRSHAHMHTYEPAEEE